MKGRENLFLLGIALLFALLGFMKPAYATEEVTLYLHKRVFPDITTKIPYDLTIPEEKRHLSARHCRKMVPILWCMIYINPLMKMRK